MSIAQGKTDSEVKNYLCGRFFLVEVDFFSNIFDAGKADDDWVSKSPKHEMPKESEKHSEKFRNLTLQGGKAI